MLVTWVEIPVADYDRAKAFYEALMDAPLNEFDSGNDGRRTASLPHDGTGVGMSINQTEGFEPGANGPLPYMYAGEVLDVMLARVEPAGGTVIIPKTPMGESAGGGFYATIRDTEGNTLALYAQK